MRSSSRMPPGKIELSCQMLSRMTVILFKETTTTKRDLLLTLRGGARKFVDAKLRRKKNKFSFKEADVHLMVDTPFLHVARIISPERWNFAANTVGVSPVVVTVTVVPLELETCLADRRKHSVASVFAG